MDSRTPGDVGATKKVTEYSVKRASFGEATGASENTKLMSRGNDSRPQTSVLL